LYIYVRNAHLLFCLGSYCPDAATVLPCPAGTLLNDLVVLVLCVHSSSLHETLSLVNRAAEAISCLSCLSPHCFAASDIMSLIEGEGLGVLEITGFSFLFSQALLLPFSFLPFCFPHISFTSHFRTPLPHVLTRILH
jgi:hypothetical protein